MPLTAYIVEDNAAIRESLSEALVELAGIERVGFAGRSDAAIRWLTDPANPWDVAIVDLLLEDGGSGLDVLRALRARAPARNVVVLTATASPHVREQCLGLGCDQVFDKALETDALLDWCAALAAQAPSPAGG